MRDAGQGATEALALPGNGPAFAPMEARLVDALPTEDGWQFEPKWDGFRCIAVRDGITVDLRAKSGGSLARYFPEIVAALRSAESADFVLDGELAVPIGDTLAFDALQARLHPAESRIRRLAAETPAILILFDLLRTAEAGWITGLPLERRRAMLEILYEREKPRVPPLRLSPFTFEPAEARDWLETAGGALDGVVAKRRDGAYEPGERAMLKVKPWRSADCVVGGYRYASGGGMVGSLLLGLYDVEGRLDHVGFTSGFAGVDRKALTARLQSLRGGPGFTGRAPGGPSRWSTERSGEWEPLRPELVVEVRYDQVTGDRFRHGTKLMRWRPDKAPHQCTLTQLRSEARPSAVARFLESESLRRS